MDPLCTHVPSVPAQATSGVPSESTVAAVGLPYACPPGGTTLLAVWAPAEHREERRDTHLIRQIAGIGRTDRAEEDAAVPAGVETIAGFWISAQFETIGLVTPT